MTVLAPPLDVISKVARPYPAYLLRPGDTGLVLFAAAFLGHNDAIHMARNDMTTTCVDIDGERLAAMAELYPADWRFVHQDAWQFAWETNEQWDVVSADTFTGDLAERSLADLGLWCDLARRVVTATFVDGMEYVTPRGWNASLFPRSGNVYWLVLERA